jgi:hypothetical protein
MRQRRPHAHEPEPRDPWQIRSVQVKARDGPERLAHVYQLLLELGPFPHVEQRRSRPTESSVLATAQAQAKEHSDADRALRPRLHPTPGA